MGRAVNIPDRQPRAGSPRGSREPRPFPTALIKQRTAPVGVSSILATGTRAPPPHSRPAPLRPASRYPAGR
eukprot:scaffold13184_cov101-Isochrysis_galbana.AAC.3